MPTLMVTKATGGTAKPVGSLYVPPEVQVPDGGAGTALVDTGLDAEFLADLLSACLAHERCGVHLYRSIAGRTTDPSLRERYEEFGEQTEDHVRILEELVQGAGGDPQFVSPSARAAEKGAAGLLESTFLLGGSIDLATQELGMLEAVMLAEAKDHGNWELLALLGEQMAECDVRDSFAVATATVLAQEEEHYGWARETRTRLLFAKATGGAAPAHTAAKTDEPTRAELYTEARELGIDGRSKMTKDELSDAVAQARKDVK